MFQGLEHSSPDLPLPGAGSPRGALGATYAPWMDCNLLRGSSNHINRPELDKKGVKCDPRAYLGTPT